MMVKSRRQSADPDSSTLSSPDMVAFTRIRLSTTASTLPSCVICVSFSTFMSGFSYFSSSSLSVFTLALPEAPASSPDSAINRRTISSGSMSSPSSASSSELSSELDESDDELEASESSCHSASSLP